MIWPSAIVGSGIVERGRGAGDWDRADWIGWVELKTEQVDEAPGYDLNGGPERGLRSSWPRILRRSVNTAFQNSSLSTNDSRSGLRIRGFTAGRCNAITARQIAYLER